MANNINYKEKYLLNDTQIEVLKRIHQKIIREGLTQIGVPQAEHTVFLKSAEHTFTSLIKETQEALNEIVEKAEIKRDILKSTWKTQ